MQPKKQRFRLPMMLTHLHSKNGKHVIHSLDFDLVSVAPTAEAAWQKHDIAVQTYVEFGINRGWQEYIMHPAPPEVWEKLTPDLPVNLRPPILVAGEKRSVMEVQDEPRKIA